MAADRENKLDLAALKSVVEKMTPGEWKAHDPAWKRGSPPYKTAISAPSGTVANALTHERGEYRPTIDGGWEWCAPDPCPDAVGIVVLHNAAPALFKEIERLTTWRKRLDELKALQPGWDSYSGKPITEAAFQVAEAVLNTAGQPIPTSDGGIQIEWHCDGVDVEIDINPDGTLASTDEEEIERLRAENERLRRGDICDVCCGSGYPGTGLPCICGGEGTLSAEVCGLRQEVVRLQAQLARAEKIEEAARKITQDFEREFFVRHDHQYSGLAIYQWLENWRQALDAGKEPK